jgi:hypothetical protein
MKSKPRKKCVSCGAYRYISYMVAENIDDNGKATAWQCGNCDENPRGGHESSKEETYGL